MNDRMHVLKLFSAILGIGLFFAHAETRAAANEDEASLIEPYLESGRMAEGRKAVETALASDAQNDALRFQLAIAQMLGAVEKFGQDLHRFGLHESIFGSMVPFLRFPVPPNPSPEQPVDESVRKALGDFLGGLAETSNTLAQIKDTAQMKVPMRFGLVRLDLDSDGKATDEEALWRVYAKLSAGGRDITEEAAKEFLIKLDLGDARWMQGYCHLLSALGETILAHDTSQLFSHTAHLFFSNPKTPYDFLRQQHAGAGDFHDILDGVAFLHLLNFPVKEPQRMQAALGHLQQMTALSRQSWKAILAETDDDHEWIPSPTQTGVLPSGKVTQEMVDAWLKFLDEADSILAGKTLVPFWRTAGAAARGVNVKRVFSEPTPFDLVLWVQGTAAAPYLEEGKITAPEFWEMMNRVFRGEFLGFAIWFN